MPKSVLPLVAPTSSPRSTISIASVTMNALSLNFTTRMPLKAPTTAPTTRTANRARAAGSSVPQPDWAAGRTRRAPTAGAMPTTDSRERSNLPVIRTRDSASTTMARAAEAPRMEIRLRSVRNESLTNAPSTMRSNRAGTRASSRARRSRTVRAARVSGTRTCFTGGACVSAMVVHSFDGGDQLVVAPAGRVLGDHAAVEEDEDPVAAAQVVEFVGDDEDRGAVLAGGVHAGEQGFLGLHVDARGGVDEDEQAGVGGEGAGHDDLLRVAAGEVGDGLVRALGVDVEPVDQLGGEAALAVGADEAVAAEPGQDTERGVVTDGHAKDQALRVPVARHEAYARLQAGLHIAERQWLSA